MDLSTGRRIHAVDRVQDRAGDELIVNAVPLAMIDGKLALGTARIERITSEVDLPDSLRRLVAAGLTSPQVDVRGFPFLTQLLARRFDDVRVTTSSVKIGTGSADQVTGTARDVQVPSSGPATVGRLTARGLATGRSGPGAPPLRGGKDDVVILTAGSGNP